MVPGTPPNIKSTASAHGSESEEQFEMFHLGVSLNGGAHHLRKRPVDPTYNPNSRSRCMEKLARAIYRMGTVLHSQCIHEVAPTDGSTGPEVAGYQKTTCDLGNKYFLYHNRPRVVLQSGLTFVKQ